MCAYTSLNLPIKHMSVLKELKQSKINEMK